MSPWQGWVSAPRAPRAPRWARWEVCLAHKGMSALRSSRRPSHRVAHTAPSTTRGPCWTSLKSWARRASSTSAGPSLNLGDAGGGGKRQTWVPIYPHWLQVGLALSHFTSSFLPDCPLPPTSPAPRGPSLMPNPFCSRTHGPGSDRTPSTDPSVPLQPGQGSVLRLGHRLSRGAQAGPACKPRTLAGPHGRRGGEDTRPKPLLSPLLWGFLSRSLFPRAASSLRSHTYRQNLCWRPDLLS